MQQVASEHATQRNAGERVKPAEAARRLGKNRSTIKRYLDNHGDLLGADGLVDFDVLQQHFGDNPHVYERAARADAEPKAASSSRKGSKHRLDEIKSWDAELEFAQKIGQLVDPTGLVDVALDAVTALRDKLMAPEHTTCERMADERDPLVIKQIWRDANRAALDELASAFQRIFGAPADAAS